MGHSHSGFASTKLKPPNNSQPIITPPVVHNIHISTDIYPSAPNSPSVPITATAPFSPSSQQSTNTPYYEQSDYQSQQKVESPYENGYINTYYANIQQPTIIRKPSKRAHSYRARKESVTENTSHVHKQTDFAQLAEAKIPKENIMNQISSVYKYIKQLGTGASSRVLLVENIETNNKYAMKELLRNNVNNHYLFLFEYKILTMLKGDESDDGIVQIHDIYMDQVSYYIVMEYCSGGDLLCKILSSHHFSEQQAVKYIKSILEAMDIMHDKNICHRDLKPNNIVFNQDNVLKIIDFGQSVVIDNNEQMHPFKGVGTTCFVPPEFHRSRSGLELKKGDLWSIGCVCFLLMAGKSLFGGNNAKEIWTQICIFNEEYLDGAWPQNIVLSKECKDFIGKLLKRNVHQRMSIKEALKHEWITMENVSDKHLGEQVMIGIHQIVETNKLQKILADAILEEMNENEVKILMQNIKDKDDVIAKLIEYHHTNYHAIDMDLAQINHEKLLHQRAHHIMNTLTEYKLNLDGLKFNDIDAKYDDEDDDDFDEELTFDSVSSIAKQNHHIKSVSVSEFKAIMKRSKKLYNVEKLISDLDPNKSGFIAFDAIAIYLKPVKTHKILPGLDT